MWSSIQQVLYPESLQEAGALKQNPEAVFFAGGSYLVAEKEAAVNTLIDINHLIDTSIEVSEKGLRIGAGCTLEQLRAHFQDGYAQALLSSCPSRNIRNQRTIGGEIARRRVDSDLYVLMLVSQVELLVHGFETSIKLNDWDGQGLITQIFIPASRPKIERVALLDSAPAFVLVAANMDAENINVAVGGQVDQVVSATFERIPEEAEVKEFLAEVSQAFVDDHFGSVDYKQHLVNSLLYELTVNQ